LAHWRRESSFSTWLFALAANVYRTELKRFPTETMPMDAAPEPSLPAAQHLELEEQRRYEVVRRAVLALPLRYREPMVLYYFHEMDVAAVSHTLGLPEGTLKARLSRARALLRQRFPHLEHLRCGQPPAAQSDEGFAFHPCENNNVRRVGQPQFSESEVVPTIGKEA
jgi:RNA polymerase sigma-70 factor (ECF subfamily)